MNDTYKFQIESSAETVALEKTLALLKEIKQVSLEASKSVASLESELAKIGGRTGRASSLAGLDKEISKTEQQLVKSRAADQKAALASVAEESRKTGKATGDLSKKLGEVDTAQPVGRLQRFGAEVRKAALEVPYLGKALTMVSGGAAALVAGIAAVIGGILALGVAVVSIARSGVGFNSTIEDAQLGIAAVMKQFDRVGKFSTFDDAMASSAAAIEMLKKAAASSPASFEQLVQAYQGTAGAMAASGMSLKEQIDTIVTMSQTLAGLGIRPEQMLQETRAILTGNITEDAAAARILGITRAEIEGAKKKGELYDFLKNKLSAFAEAGARSGENLTVILSNIGDAAQQMSGKLSKPLFEGLKRGASEVLALLNGLDALMTKIGIGGPAKSAAVTPADKAREAEIASRELAAKPLDGLIKYASDAAKNFDELAESIRRAAAEAQKLDNAKTDFQISKIDMEEQLALRNASGPDQEAKIRADFAEQRRGAKHVGNVASLDDAIKTQEDIVRQSDLVRQAKLTERDAAIAEAERARENALAARSESSAPNVAARLKQIAAQKLELEGRLESGTSVKGSLLAQFQSPVLQDLARSSMGIAEERAAIQAEIERLTNEEQKPGEAVIDADAYLKTAESNAQNAIEAYAKILIAAGVKISEAERNISTLTTQRATLDNKATAEEIAAQTAADKERQNQIDAVSREAQMNNAIGREDETAVGNLKWMQSYQDTIDKGVPEWMAKWSANEEAFAGQAKAAAANSTDVSNLAQRGGSVGESLAAAAADAQRRTQLEATRAVVTLTQAITETERTLKSGNIKVIAKYG